MLFVAADITTEAGRAEVLAVGQSAPAITLVVNVAAAACASPDANGQCTTVNTATVSGGGEHASRQSDNQGMDDGFESAPRASRPAPQPAPQPARQSAPVTSNTPFDQLEGDDVPF